MFSKPTYKHPKDEIWPNQEQSSLVQTGNRISTTISHRARLDNDSHNTQRFLHSITYQGLMTLLMIQGRVQLKSHMIQLTQSSTICVMLLGHVILSEGRRIVKGFMTRSTVGLLSLWLWCRTRLPSAPSPPAGWWNHHSTQWRVCSTSSSCPLNTHKQIAFEIDVYMRYNDQYVDRLVALSLFYERCDVTWRHKGFWEHCACCHFCW